jgi:hypothetical protein
MSAFTFYEVDKSVIKVGDTILHKGKEMTVSKNDITRSSFMGISIFGDCYHSGYKKVLKGALKNERK